MLRYFLLLLFVNFITYINAETCTLSTEPYKASEDSGEFVPVIPDNVNQCPGGLTIGSFQQNDACRLQGVQMESTSEHQFELSNIINFRTQMVKNNHPTLLPDGSTSSNFGSLTISDGTKTQLPEVAAGEGHRFIKSKITLKVDPAADLQRYQSCSVVNLESDLAKYTTFVPHGKVLGYCWNAANARDTTLSRLEDCPAFETAGGAALINVGTCDAGSHGTLEGCPSGGTDGDARMVSPFEIPRDVETSQKLAYLSDAASNNGGGLTYSEVNSLFREEGTCTYTPSSTQESTTYKGVTKAECLGYCNDYTDKAESACTGGSLAWIDPLDTDVSLISEATDAVWSTDNEFSCEYYVHNQMYVGTLKLGLAFEKTANTVGVGGSVLTKIIVPMKITPGLNDPNFFLSKQKGYIDDSFQNSMLRDLVISYDTACITPGGYLDKDRFYASGNTRQTSGGSACHTGDNINGVNDNDNVKQALGSSATGGTISLKLTGVFLDERYKTVSQSGVETLTSSMGDFLILKQGMELHLDYRSFNDVTKDKFSQGADNSINLEPIDFRHRKLHSSTVGHVEEAENGGSGATYKDFSNKGAPLDGQNQPQLQIYGATVATGVNQRFKATGAGDVDATDIADAYRCELGTSGTDTSYTYSTAESTRGACHSQYLLSHTFVFEYGDLPHFKPQYLACDICDSQLAIKGFKETDGVNERYQINTKLSVSIPNLPLSTNKIPLANIKLNAKSDQFKLQPDLYYKLSEFFDVEAEPNQLLVQASSGAEIASLDDDLDFDEYFTFSTKDARGFDVVPSCDNAADTSCGVDVACLDRTGDGLGFVCENVMVFDSTGANEKVGDPNNCQSLKTLKVYQLKTDTRQGFEDLFNTECYIKVPRNYYGSTYKIDFENAQLGTCSDGASTDKTACEAVTTCGTGSDEQCVWTSTIVPESTEIKEVDQRKILISNPEDDQSTTLTLTERVQASVSRVATTITMEFIKELPNKQIPAGLQHKKDAYLNDQYITFRLKGDTSALAGYISTSDGSGECAGNNMYWKHTAQANRKYKNVWAGNTNSNLQGHEYYTGTKCSTCGTDCPLDYATGYAGQVSDDTECAAGFINGNLAEGPTEERIQALYLNGKPFGTCKGHNGLNAAVLSHDCGGDSSCTELDEAYCTCNGLTDCTGIRPGTPGAWTDGKMCLGGTYTKGSWSDANSPKDITKSTAVLVTYRQCQEAGGQWQIVSIPDASSFSLNNGAYECTGIACKIGHASGDKCKDDGGAGACDLLGYDSNCLVPAVQEEMLFTTSRVNGDSKTHLIQSTGACTGTLDFQLEDTTANQEFAIYKTRIDCSRVSSELLTDKVEIRYEYETVLDLSKDLLTIDAIHSANVNGPTAEGKCNHPVFTGSGAGENRAKCDAGECVAAKCKKSDGSFVQSDCQTLIDWCDYGTDGADADATGTIDGSDNDGVLYGTCTDDTSMNKATCEGAGEVWTTRCSQFPVWDANTATCNGVTQVSCEQDENAVVQYVWDGPSVVPALGTGSCSSSGTCSNPSVGTSRRSECTGHCADATDVAGNGANHLTSADCTGKSDCGAANDQACQWTAAADATYTNPVVAAAGCTFTSGGATPAEKCHSCTGGSAACIAAGSDFHMVNGVCTFKFCSDGVSTDQATCEGVTTCGDGSEACVWNAPTEPKCSGANTESEWSDDLGYSWLAGNFEPTYTVAAFFGGCTDDNQLSGLLASGDANKYDFNDNDQCTETNYKFHEDYSKNKLELLVADGGATGNITDGLLALRRCASNSAANNGVTEIVNTDVVPTKASYIITYDLAMQYRRDTHTAAFGDANQYLYYCDSQTFTATIDRDATASVTASQIKAAGLNRAVMVKDIGWIGNDEKGSNCNEGYYRLEVLMSSMDSDARDASNWQPSELTKAMIDTASTASNPNNMRIHAQGMKTIITDPGSVKSMDAGWTTADLAEGGVQTIATEGDQFIDSGNTFKVRGSCIQILECQEDMGAYQAPTGEDWYDFSQNFVTDLVIRGTFLESPVDTKIQLTLNFYECPVTETAAVTGEIRVGLQTDCTDPQNPMVGGGLDRFYSQSIAQRYAALELSDAATDPTMTCTRDTSGVITADSGSSSCTHYDCTSAFPDDVLRVTGFSFATIGGCSDAASNPAIKDATREMYTPHLDAFDTECGLFKSEYEEAEAQQWEPELVEVWIDRYDTSQGVPREVSTTQICECDKDDGSSGTGAHPNRCWVVNGGVTNLQDFTTGASLVAGEGFKHYVSCGSHGVHDSTANGKVVCDDIDSDGNVDANLCTGANLVKLSTITSSGDDLFKHQFPLMPLAAASADQFVIRYEVVLYSKVLSTRRRLRASKVIRKGRASHNNQLMLTAGEKFARGSTNGFRVISLDHTVRTMGSPAIQGYENGKTGGPASSGYRTMSLQECWDRREDIQLAFDRLSSQDQDPGDSGYQHLVIGDNRDSIPLQTLTNGPFGCYIKEINYNNKDAGTYTPEYTIYYNPHVGDAESGGKQTVKVDKCGKDDSSNPMTEFVCLGIEGSAAPDHDHDDDEPDGHEHSGDMEIGVLIAIIAGGVVILGGLAFIGYKLMCGKNKEESYSSLGGDGVYGETTHLVNNRKEKRFTNLRY